MPGPGGALGAAPAVPLLVMSPQPRGARLPALPPCSQSGRFDRLKEIAVEFAFLLKVQGMKDVPLQPSGPPTATK